MIKYLDGATRLHFIIGDPIAQVRSPEGISKSLQDKGINAICVPAHIASKDLDTFFKACGIMQNLDSIIVTIPHKIPSASYCDKLSPRSEFLGAVNVIKVTENGYEGDMLDGLGYVLALKEKGCTLEGKRALLCGLGGAGSAIAHALTTNGIGELAVFDLDQNRQSKMIDRLNSLGKCKVIAGTRDLEGFDIAINATPTGMKETDPLPFAVDNFPDGLWAGDVITKPVETAWIKYAKSRGSNVVVGLDMFNKVKDLLIEFLVTRAD